MPDAMAWARRADRVGVVAPYLAAVAATLWYFRPTLLHRMLPGDTGDARWTVAITEHWYRVWQGEEAIRDLSFYHPIARTLGSSDPLLFQGQVHAAARMLGLDPVKAWFASQLLTFLVGALGLAALSRRFLVRAGTRTAFVLLSALAYPLVVKIGHVQMLAAPAFAWLLLAALELQDEDGAHRRRWFAVLMVGAPVLAMSSWYAFGLGSLLVGVTVLLLVVLSDRGAGARVVRRYATAASALLRSPIGVATLAASAACWLFAAWIFLPARHLMPATLWSEVVLYSPRLSDLLNVDGSSGAPWGGPSFQAGTTNTEQQLGFTPLVALVCLVAAIATLRSALLRSATPERSDVDGSAAAVPPISATVRLAIALGIAGSLVLILADERGYSLFRGVWERVPGMEAIRAPFRIQLVTYPAAFIVLLSWLESSWRARGVAGRAASPAAHQRAARSLACVVALLSGVLLLEMHRDPHARWEAGELVPPRLRAHAAQVRAECPTFVLVPEPARAPFDSIDAVLLSMATGVPTMQGHSRRSPTGHPGSAGTPADLVAWARRSGSEGRVCVVSPAGVSLFEEAGAP